MTINRRWLDSIIATSRRSALDMPWQSSVRNNVPDFGPTTDRAGLMPILEQPFRSQAQAAR